MEYTERFREKILKDSILYTKCRKYLEDKGMDNINHEISGSVWSYVYVFKNGTVFKEVVSNFFDQNTHIVNVTEKVLLLDENGMWEN